MRKLTAEAMMNFNQISSKNRLYFIKIGQMTSAVYILDDVTTPNFFIYTLNRYKTTKIMFLAKMFLKRNVKTTEKKINNWVTQLIMEMTSHLTCTTNFNCSNEKK